MQLVPQLCPSLLSPTSLAWLPWLCPCPVVPCGARSPLPCPREHRRRGGTPRRCGGKCGWPLLPAGNSLPQRDPGLPRGCSLSCHSLSPGSEAKRNRPSFATKNGVQLRVPSVPGAGSTLGQRLGGGGYRTFWGLASGLLSTPTSPLQLARRQPQPHFFAATL